MSASEHAIARLLHESDRQLSVDEIASTTALTQEELAIGIQQLLDRGGVMQSVDWRYAYES